MLGFCSTTSGVFRSTGEVVSEHLKAHRFAFNLSGSIWVHLEGSVWLFRVAELFGYDFQTILHLADVRHCSQWKDQQKTLWKEVGKATGWRAGRCQHVKVSELLSIEKYDQAVMDFLADTEVGKFPPK